MSDMEEQNKKQNPKKENKLDALAKKILSYKRILAYLVQAVVEEYQDCTIEEIIRYIEPETLEKRIKGLNTENTTVDYGRVNYDLLFQIDLPEGKRRRDEKNYVIMNLEAQSQIKLSYQFASRGINYTARILAAQKGVHFQKSEYHKIKKVYSIWLLLSDKIPESYISSYSFQEKCLLGNERVHKLDYDLQQVIMIGVGKNKKEKEQKILDILRLLFYKEYSNYKERAKELERRYNITLLDEEVEGMCNLHLMYEERGYDKGILAAMSMDNMEAMRLGEARGELKGEKRGMVKILLMQNNSDKDILELTHISPEELATLKKELSSSL